MRSFSRITLPVVLLLSACGGSNDAAPVGGAGGSQGAAGSSTQPTSELPCSVERAVSRCQTCHGPTPAFGAPMSLATYDDFFRDAPTMPGVNVTSVALDRMRDIKKPMPPAPNARASFEEVSAVEEWYEGGRPKRAAGEVCPVGDPMPKPAPKCEPNHMLAPVGKWTMPKAVADEYVCYGVDIPGEDKKRHITGIVPFVDNTKIVHHLLVFETPKAENGVPHPCEQLFPFDWKAIYAWAPGTQPYELPEEAGFPVAAGETTHLAVQVHYSNIPHDEGETDATGLGICITDQTRKYDADIFWMGGVDFAIPAHATATTECKFQWEANYSEHLPLHVFQAWPHMHKLGTKLETVVIRPDGTERPLGLADPFSFDNQLTQPLSETIGPGDTVRTRCTWQNDTSKTVKFGEATSEEMCFNLVAYYPRINLPQFNGPAAAYISDCNMVK